MRNLPLHTTLACFAAVCGLASAPAAKASNLDLVNGAACQLSIPTTATGVRPKASGFRNESTTTSSFVICTMPRSTTTGEYSQVGLIGYSLDGAAHAVTCTAVAGNTLAPKYSTKTANIRDATDTPFVWSSADFGGTDGGAISGSLYFSITCNLPPQTAISYIQAWTP